MRAFATITTVTVVALALVGCTATAAPVQESAAPTPTVQAFGADGCSLVTTDKQGTLSGPILDGGERNGARGPAILDADGNITGYEIQPYDSISAIADRFCMEPKKIYYRNGWRPVFYPLIHPGEMILAPVL